jgi:two-component system CheB/CheR fusion protein
VLVQPERVARRARPAMPRTNCLSSSCKDETLLTLEPVSSLGAETPAATGCPIVGIGASAGGLGAFEVFFSAMPTDSEPGMSFVIVQHLAPDHESVLTDLIQRCTRMRVFQVESGMTVEPNCIYIIPPNRDMALLHGKLELLEPTAPRGRRLPIDFFLKSLAQDQHERAIGIVFSGTGSDGTLGVRAIKGEGGMVMVQLPGSAEYDGMPRSAIATGLVDFVLPPVEMPAQLIAYARHAFGGAAQPVSPEPPAGDDARRAIFVLLRAKTGHDFSQYKQSTINRRVQRRMAVHQVEKLDDYVRLLQAEPDEVDALFRDLLIRVTSFFRDAEAFEVLQSELAARVFGSKSNGDSVRVWVPGCCTGEEAYSLAILLQEQMEALKQSLTIQIFATDIDGAAIERARTGMYPAGIAAEITPERLARNFDAEPDHGRYRVKKRLRDLLIFSEQDVVKDPPFSRLDLISCRNLLIYLEPELQSHLISLFHYALKPGGLLFLGTSESVGDLRDLFAALQPKSKLYLRRDAASSLHGAASGKLSPSRMDVAGPVRTAQHPPRGRRLPLRELTERALLQHCGAVGALVDERGNILYLHGRTGLYLEPAPGESSLNALAMAREGLRRDLTIAMHEAVATRKPSRRPGLRVRTNGSYELVDLTVEPVTTEPGSENGPSLYLIVLEATRAKEPTGPAAKAKVPAGATADDLEADDGRRVAELERELRAQTDFLASNRRELETANEELKSANEELQSLNEESQSTNEELETSKEELQSVNEELVTVNAELQQRVAELSRANNDLNNLMAGTGVATIFVDHRLRIQRFTPAATTLINLMPGDVGRPLGHIASNLVGYDCMVTDVQAVLATLNPLDVEVRTASAWYLLRIRPYRTLENVIEGAVITFTDITEFKRGQEGLRRLAVVVRDSRDAVVVQDLSGHILAWNPGAERAYGWTEAEALGMNIRDLIPEALRADTVAAVQRLGEGGSIQPFHSQRIAKDGHIVEIELTASALTNEAGVQYAVSTTERSHD